MDTITLLIDKPYTVDDQLEMTALFIVEEWVDSERRVEIDITIKMKTPETEEEINFTSADRNFTWQNYEFEYYGGGRKEVHLKVRQKEN